MVPSLIFSPLLSFSLLFLKYYHISKRGSDQPLKQRTSERIFTVMGNAGTAAIAPADSPSKYAGDGDFSRMKVGLVGTCISPALLVGTAKKRSGSNENLSGIVEDGRNMYSYFRANGAEVQLYSFTIPSPPAEELKRNIKKFLQAPGNMKTLYLSGHGNEAGDLVLGYKEYLSAHECLLWLAESNFGGMITFIVDACHSGKWAQNVSELIHLRSREGWEDVYWPLRRAIEGKGTKTMINCRMSSLAHETSGDGGPGVGGCYTSNLLWYLRREWRWSKEAAGSHMMPKLTWQPKAGWGTKGLFKHVPSDNDTVFGISLRDPQSDVIFDVTMTDDGKTQAYFPENRRKYIQHSLQGT